MMQCDSRCSKTNHNGQTELHLIGSEKKYSLDSVILLDYKDGQLLGSKYMWLNLSVTQIQLLRIFGNQIGTVIL